MTENLPLGYLLFSRRPCWGDRGANRAVGDAQRSRSAVKAKLSCPFFLAGSLFPVQERVRSTSLSAPKKAEKAKGPVRRKGSRGERRRRAHRRFVARRSQRGEVGRMRREKRNSGEEKEEMQSPPQLY